MSSRTDKHALGLDVLMYHSVSSAAGPTSIPVDVFRAQIEALRETGHRSIPLECFGAWQRGEELGLDASERPVMITFDDGFRDFADAAFPILRDNGFTATVFLPAARLGGNEDWVGANVPARPLMDWSTVRALADEGVSFGGHSLTHADLTTLAPDRLTEEVKESQDAIAQQLGKPVETFAPPYGRTNARVQAEIEKWARVSVGVKLGRATRTSATLDVPRIEMHYFRDPHRWRSYVEGRGVGYLRVRQLARGLRNVLTRLANPRSSGGAA